MIRNITAKTLKVAVGLGLVALLGSFLTIEAAEPSKQRGTAQQRAKAKANQEQFGKASKESRAAAAAVSNKLQRGEKLYKACGICHGKSGLTTAPGQVEGRNILGYTYQNLMRELISYREGKADNGGLNVIMAANMKGWSDSEIDDVSTYIMKLVDEARLKGKLTTGARNARDKDANKGSTSGKNTSNKNRNTSNRNR